MNVSTTQQDTDTARTPLWRRFTALFTLGSMVIIGGVVVAALAAVTLLLVLFIVDRAIA